METTRPRNRDLVKSIQRHTNCLKPKLRLRVGQVADNSQVAIIRMLHASLAALSQIQSPCVYARLVNFKRVRYLISFFKNLFYFAPTVPVQPVSSIHRWIHRLSVGCQYDEVTESHCAKSLSLEDLQSNSCNCSMKFMKFYGGISWVHLYTPRCVGSDEDSESIAKAGYWNGQVKRSAQMMEILKRSCQKSSSIREYNRAQLRLPHGQWLGRTG